MRNEIIYGVMSKYGQVGADGVWRNKEGDIRKTDDKKM